MIKIELLTKRNWEEAMAIEVSDSQKSFVPSVAECLAFAYLKPWDETLDPYVLLADGTILGVFYLSYTPGSKDNYWIGGFQIDKRHQGKGYGTQALIQIVEFVKD
ncbi:RimJ/RimL family protein N-acetyltransferase [Sporosarcina luteola]|nr:RimJ/RimL family protein N-acetyltransferase [Sporosarcina luteola]